MSVVLDNLEIVWASIIAQYHIRVMLLFVYNRSQKIFGKYEPFISLWFKKQTQASKFLTIILLQWKEKWLAVSCKTSTNHWRQTTWNSNEINFQIRVSAVTAVVKQKHKLREGKGKLLPVFNCCFIERNQCQYHNFLSPDSHESGGPLFGRLESQFGCAA